MHLSISLISLSIFFLGGGTVSAHSESFGQMKVVHLLFQILNPLPTGLILSPAPHQLSLEPFTLRPFRFVQRDQLFDICLYTLQAYLRTVFTCMSANLVKYLHLHKNFNWHHLLNSKENSFSCLSRAIAASSRTSSFPKATPRAQEPPPHSRSIPQAPPRAQEPPTHSRSIPQAPPRAQEPPTHSRSRPAHQPASDLLNQSKYYNFATI